MATKQRKQDSMDKAPGAKAQGHAVALAADSSPSKAQAMARYFEDAKTELGKVSWPTQKEVKATAIAVLVLVVIMSFFLGIVDIILSKIVESILSIGL